jgi:hypothetical protein
LAQSSQICTGCQQLFFLQMTIFNCSFQMYTDA